MKNKKREKCVKCKEVSNKEQSKKTSDEYGYDFVAELSHFTNIDEQRKNAKRLEKL